jgi:hypothetical protein
VRILCTNQALNARGGSESYLETVVAELLRLGHDVVAWSRHRGPIADRLSRLGCTVHEDLADVGAVDVIHAQHASTALAARAQFPAVPLVFACHSWAFDLEDPPAAAQPAAFLAFNDVVAARLRASRLGEQVPIHRLRQPVTITAMESERFPIARDPLIGVAINRDGPGRHEQLEAACRETGIHLVAATRKAGLSGFEDLTSVMMRADVVFAVGRTALEAMALARAAFVFDQTGTAGFITADRYPAIEASGFTPAPGPPLTVDTLVAELRSYERDLGQLGRELVGRHHAARAHAAQLVDVYRSVITAPTVPTVAADPLVELAELEQKVFDLEQRTRDAQWLRARAERRTVRLQIELDRIWHSISWRITRPLRALHRRPDDHQ